MIDRRRRAFQTFREVVTRAENECDAALAMRAYQGTQTDPRLALEMLGRRRPDRYGTRRVEMSGPAGAPIAVQQVTDGMDDHERAIPGLLRRFVAGIFAPYSDGLQARLNAILDARGRGVAVLIFHIHRPPGVGV